MENHHARKIGKYCRARYADIGHATTQRPAGKFNFGHNFANFIVRRARGERIYKNSSSGGNRGGKTSRRKIRQTEKKIPRKFKEIYLQWKSGKISARQAAKILNVHHSTFVNYPRLKTRAWGVKPQIA